MADQPQVKVEWTIEVTERYVKTMDWDEFAALFGQDDPPTPEQFQAGVVDRHDIIAEELAGFEDEDTSEVESVDERYVTDVEVLNG